MSIHSKSLLNSTNPLHPKDFCMTSHPLYRIRIYVRICCVGVENRTQQAQFFQTLPLRSVLLHVTKAAGASVRTLSCCSALPNQSSSTQQLSHHASVFDAGRRWRFLTLGDAGVFGRWETLAFFDAGRRWRFLTLQVRWRFLTLGDAGVF
jgi:hypothetical protein